MSCRVAVALMLLTATLSVLSAIMLASGHRPRMRSVWIAAIVPAQVVINWLLFAAARRHDPVELVMVTRLWSQGTSILTSLVLMSLLAFAVARRNS